MAALAKALPTVRHFTIGNEPNLNGFWMPQFGPNGENAAAPAYLQLLAAAYDSLKAVSRNILVLGGGAVAARFGQPGALAAHALADAVHPRHGRGVSRRAGATKPIMDALSINPFPDNSSQSPAIAAPRTPRSASRTTTSS